MRAPAPFLLARRPAKRALVAATAVSRGTSAPPAPRLRGLARWRVPLTAAPPKLRADEALGILPEIVGRRAGEEPAAGRRAGGAATARTGPIPAVGGGPLRRGRPALDRSAPPTALPRVSARSRRPPPPPADAAVPRRRSGRLPASAARRDVPPPTLVELSSGRAARRLHQAQTRAPSASGGSPAASSQGSRRRLAEASPVRPAARLHAAPPPERPALRRTPVEVTTPRPRRTPAADPVPPGAGTRAAEAAHEAGLGGARDALAEQWSRPVAGREAPAELLERLHHRPAGAAPERRAPGDHDSPATPPGPARPAARTAAPPEARLRPPSLLDEVADAFGRRLPPVVVPAAPPVSPTPAGAPADGLRALAVDVPAEGLGARAEAAARLRLVAHEAPPADDALAARLKRILVEEARRHGIDV